LPAGSRTVLTVVWRRCVARGAKALLRILNELSDSGVAVLFGSHLTMEGARCPR